MDGSRTPFIKARGKPGPFTPVDLAVQCGRPLLLRQPFAPDAFDQVILGCVNVIRFQCFFFLSWFFFSVVVLVIHININDSNNNKGANTFTGGCARLMASNDA